MVPLFYRVPLICLVCLTNLKYHDGHNTFNDHSLFLFSGTAVCRIHYNIHLDTVYRVAFKWSSVVYIVLNDELAANFIWCHVKLTTNCHFGFHSLASVCWRLVAYWACWLYRRLLYAYLSLSSYRQQTIDSNDKMFAFNAGLSVVAVLNFAIS